jgi:putative transposase
MGSGAIYDIILCMPRINRIDIGGEIYHITNRANARIQIFDNPKDYQLFEEVLNEAKERTHMCIYAYCIMPNHWHLVVSPKESGDLQKFMGWLTMTHTQRWHASHKTIGSGHLYQGRYKSFLVQSNNYFLQLCRYVERNPLRARLVKNAENWKWSSFWRRERGTKQQKKLLNIWPITITKNYKEWVNTREDKEELKEIRYSVNKGKPFGNDRWVVKIINKFKLDSTLRNPGRPKKGS